MMEQGTLSVRDNNGDKMAKSVNGAVSCGRKKTLVWNKNCNLIPVN